MNTPELLARIATTLKQGIAPAVTEDYPRTQAHMAAVVLDKLARGLAVADAHREAAAADVAALVHDLAAALPVDATPAALGSALARLAADRDNGALAAVVATLYAVRGELGEVRFENLLGRVRETLRRDIDRRCEVAR